MLSQIFIADEVLAADEVGNVKSGDEFIKKCWKLLKIGEFSKSQKLAKLRKK